MSDSATAADRYDVCLSFAAEQRQYVEQVATILRDIGFRVFYDGFETHELWGRDLVEHLDLIYRERSDHCIMFISADYARRAWPNHERRSAQARALFGGGDYVLPVRCDDTEVPGVLRTIGFLDAREVAPEGLVIQLLRKLGRPAPAAVPGHATAPGHSGVPGHAATPDHSAVPRHSAAPGHSAVPSHSGATPHGGEPGRGEPGPGAGGQVPQPQQAVGQHYIGQHYIGGDYVAGDKSGGDTIVSGGKHVYSYRDGEPGHQPER